MRSLSSQGGGSGGYEILDWISPHPVLSPAGRKSWRSVIRQVEPGFAASVEIVFPVTALKESPQSISPPRCRSSETSNPCPWLVLASAEMREQQSRVLPGVPSPPPQQKKTNPLHVKFTGRGHVSTDEKRQDSAISPKTFAEFSFLCRCPFLCQPLLLLLL